MRYLLRVTQLKAYDSFLAGPFAWEHHPDNHRDDLPPQFRPKGSALSFRTWTKLWHKGGVLPPAVREEILVTLMALEMGVADSEE